MTILLFYNYAAVFVKTAHKDGVVSKPCKAIINSKNLIFLQIFTLPLDKH